MSSNLRRRPPPPLNLPLRFSAYGGEASAFIDAGTKVSWTATLSPDAAGWLSFSGLSTGTGPGLVSLAAGRNTTEAHAAKLTVRLAGRARPLVWDAIQASALPLATLNTSVLEVPFPTTPRVMELGIAGKFIATEIQKIPEPFDLIALAIVEVLVALVGELAIALRGALSPVVPEPLTWFGAPEPYDALTLVMPATAVCIQEETALLLLYLPIEVASGGE
ncbi:MAG: hypothetical protein HYV95_09250 [Opitutae bacterium]|nr:hypothetical protein [Opitutae bacterium]